MRRDASRLLSHAQAADARCISTPTTMRGRHVKLLKAAEVPADLMIITAMIGLRE